VNILNETGNKAERITMTAHEAAAFIGISYWSILEMCKRSEIPYIPVGKKKLFQLDSLINWLTSCENCTVKKDSI